MSTIQPAPAAAKKKDGKDKPEFPVINNETLDLDAYIAGYVGHTKVRRLVYIAERCPQLRLKAYRLAIEELKKGSNTQLYVDVISKAREALGDRLGDEWGLDNTWKTTTERLATEKSTRLEIELNTQKRDQERDPTRRAYEALGHFHSERGDWNNALTMYTTMKDYCGNNKNTLEMCQSVIKASIHSGTMSYVNTHAGRVKNLPDVAPEIRSSASAALGLYSLKAGNYRGAAEMFLEVGTDIEGKYNDIITVRDCAIYGAMTSLASFTRPEIKARVLGNPEFKKLLEKAPGWRAIVTNFYSSNYSLCFDAILRMRPDLQLDLYLGPHVDKLIARMRDRAMIQYFRPFVAVKLPAMAAAFKMEVPDLERSLANLIADNQIVARIDSANKILYARHADQRNATYVQALNVGTTYVRDCKALLMRMSLVEHQFVVRPAERRGGKGGREDDDEGKNGQ